MLKDTLNKGISTPIAIGIVLILVILVGGFTWWQYEVIEEEDNKVAEEADEVLTREEIENTEYYVPYIPKRDEERIINLREGSYTEEDSSGKLKVKILEDKIAFGDLNGDGKKDSVVILDVWDIVNYETGGTDWFHSSRLAILINDNGKPTYLTSKYIGDKEKINSIFIESGKVILDMLILGPHDALCCPSVKKIVKYNLIENKLIEDLGDFAVDWETYRNEEYGFEVKYSEDWQLFQPGLNAFAGLNLIHLEIFKIENELFYGRVFLYLFTDYEKPCEEFKIDDLKFLWFDQGFKEILVKRRNHQCFTFSYVIDKESKETEEFKTSFIKNFHKSFSTLKFIKKDITEDWKVYQDRNKDFEIRYPPDLLVTEIEEGPLSGMAFHTSPQWVIGLLGPSNGMVIEVKEELGGKKASDIRDMDELREAIEEELQFAPKPRRVTLPFSPAFIINMGTNKYCQYDYYIKNEDKIVKFSLTSGSAIFSPYNQMLSTFKFLD